MVILILDVIDSLCIFYFTLEYSVRFMCAPKKFRFILQPMNLVRIYKYMFRLSHTHEFSSFRLTYSPSSPST